MWGPLAPIKIRITHVTVTCMLHDLKQIPLHGVEENERRREFFDVLHTISSQDSLCFRRTDFPRAKAFNIVAPIKIAVKCWQSLQKLDC